MEVKTLEEWSVRWLSKALSAYAPEGCLGDVVNLALGLFHAEAPSKEAMSEANIVKCLRTLGRRIEQGQMCALRSHCVLCLPRGPARRRPARHPPLRPNPPAARIRRDGLWIPTHLQHDCELDDTLAWLLLERLCQLAAASPPRVLVQLPTESRFDKPAGHFRNHGGSVFRDPDSKNADPVSKNLAHLMG